MKKKVFVNPGCLFVHVLAEKCVIVIYQKHSNTHFSAKTCTNKQPGLTNTFFFILIQLRCDACGSVEIYI
jgi:hypothetical protein